jgi:hypothetical protein
LTFQPYAVQCLTCGSRLRVTDAGLVGTITTCPKCGSMVQIDPPTSAPGAPTQVAVGHSDVDSDAITQEAITFESEPASESPPIDSGFAGSAGLTAARDEESVGPLQWQSERTRRSRQIALVVALSLAGSLTAIAAFSWFVRSSHTGTIAPADLPVVEEPEPAAEPDAVAEPEPAAEAEPVAEADPAAESEPVAASDPPATAVETQSPAASPETEVPAPAPADLMPEPIIPTDLLPADPIQAEPAGEAGLMELPADLMRFTDILPRDGEQRQQSTLDAPPTKVDVVEIEAAAEDEADPLVIKTNKLNLRADLGIELAIATNGYRLTDLMLLLGQITTVPIQVDWVSFDLAGIDVDTRVKVSKGWQNARALLDQVASSLGAEIREEEFLIVLTLTDKTFDEAVAPIYDLSDFADAASATKVINQFLGADPGPLQTGTTREEKQLAAFAIESLRRMRGTAGKVADQRLQRWAQATENASVTWPLVKVTKDHPLPGKPIAITQFLREAANHDGATCVVNWHDLNRHNVAPASLLYPHAAADPTQTLTSALQKFNLQARQVDAGYWWVGTEFTYDHLPVLVWTTALGENREAFTQQISHIMAGHPGDAFQIAIDPESDRALLLLPRFIVRQLPKITETLVGVTNN